MFAKGRNVSRRSRRQVSWHEHERPATPGPESACDGNACSSRETKIGKFSSYEFRCLIVLELIRAFQNSNARFMLSADSSVFLFGKKSLNPSNVRFLQKPRIYNSGHLNQTGDIMGTISCEELQFSNIRLDNFLAQGTRPNLCTAKAKGLSKRLSLVLSQNQNRLWRTLIGPQFFVFIQINQSLHGPGLDSNLHLA